MAVEVRAKCGERAPAVQDADACNDGMRWAGRAFCIGNHGDGALRYGGVYEAIAVGRAAFHRDKHISRMNLAGVVMKTCDLSLESLWRAVVGDDFYSGEQFRNRHG